MFKVIVERPRRGGSWLREHPLPKPDESSPKWQPMGRGRGTKTLNENLAPLERWLRRQVNRPWDKVYSELSGVVSVRSAVQQHVRQHVPDLVALHVHELDGVLHEQGRWGRFSPLGRWGRDRLYVCPRTGLLRLHRARRRKRGIQEEAPHP